MARIKLVTFDLDNTLWDVQTVIRGAERRMRDWLEAHVADFPGRCSDDVMQALRAAVLDDSPALRHDISALREEVLFRAIRLCGSDEQRARDQAREAFHVFLEGRHQVEFFAGALTTLEHLSSRYLLGALTNGNADFRRLRLDRYFHFGYSAAAVGVSKPAPEMFRAALRHAGAAPSEAVHVGDHPTDDVQGADAVGMHTIWVNHHRQPLPPEAPNPSRVVHALDDVPGSIADIAGG